MGDMQKHYSEIRKIDPARDTRLGDGTPNLNDRLEIGPTLLAIREWEQRGLQQPNLDRMRKHRLDRLTKYLSERDLAAALLFDPLNICLLYTSPSPRDQRGSRMPSSA